MYKHILLAIKIFRAHETNELIQIFNVLFVASFEVSVQAFEKPNNFKA